MELKLQINETEVIEVAKKEAVAKATNIAREVVSTYFQSKANWGKADGPGTLIVKQKIDEYLLSKDLETKIVQAIDKHLTTAIDTLAQEHVRRSIGKIVFAANRTKPDIAVLKELLETVVANQGE